MVALVGWSINIGSITCSIGIRDHKTKGHLQMWSSYRGGRLGHYIYKGLTIAIDHSIDVMIQLDSTVIKFK